MFSPTRSQWLLKGFDSMLHKVIYLLLNVNDMCHIGKIRYNFYKCSFTLWCALYYSTMSIFFSSSSDLFLDQCPLDSVNIFNLFTLSFFNLQSGALGLQACWRNYLGQDQSTSTYHSNWPHWPLVESQQRTLSCWNKRKPFSEQEYRYWCYCCWSPWNKQKTWWGIKFLFSYYMLLAKASFDACISSNKIAYIPRQNWKPKNMIDVSNLSCADVRDARTN